MPARMVFFKRRFPSTFEDMSSVLRSALAALTERDLIAPGEEFYARLCLEEALVNAIQHGNHGDRARHVSLEMSEEDDTCCISVCDEGNGFCTEDISIPDCSRKGGRGLCLIKHFMDHVAFDRSRNCFEMAFRRKTLSKGG